MLVQIPFAYRVDGVTRDGRSVRGDVRIESFAADIREMNENDAPIAFFYLDGPRPRSLPNVVRIGSGGYFYRTTPWNAGNGVINPSLAASFLTRSENNGRKEAYSGYIDERGYLPNSPEANRILEWLRRPSMPDDVSLAESFQEIHTTDRELRLIEAQEFAARLAIIDGNVVFQCHEPKIVVQLDSDLAPAVILGWSGSTRLHTTINRGLGVHVGTRTRFFRADDLEGAKAFIAELGIENHMDYAKEFICKLPQVMAFDPVRDYAERLAASAVFYTTEDVGSLDADSIGSWLLLRDGVKSLDSETIVEHVRSLTPNIGNKASRHSMQNALVEWDSLSGSTRKAETGSRPTL